MKTKWLLLLEVVLVVGIKTPIEIKEEYKLSKAWLRVQLRYLEITNEDYVAAEKDTDFCLPARPEETPNEQAC